MIPAMGGQLVVEPARDRAGLEAVAEVKRRLTPHEPVGVALLEHTLTSDPRTAFLVAHLDGAVAGAATARPSSQPGRLFAMVRTVPELRGRGVGSALLSSAGEHAAALGLTAIWGRVDVTDAPSLRFVQRRGFAEVGREFESQLDVSTAGPASDPPPGVVIVSLAQRPDLARDAYEVQRATLPDMPSPTPPQAGSYERWRAGNLDGPGALPGGCMVALADGRTIGYAGLEGEETNPGVAEHLLTGVLREWRGRGVATALKRAQIAWARTADIHTLVTSNDGPNDSMRAVNAGLGYRVARETVVVEAATPLETANRRRVG